MRAYSPATSANVADTVTVERAHITDVELSKVSALLPRAFGTLLAAAISAVGLASANGLMGPIPPILLVGYAPALACFVGSANRWRLNFSDGETTHSIVQPIAWQRRIINGIADAIQTAAKVLQGRLEAAPTVR
jgi:hypothetical protein